MGLRKHLSSINSDVKIVSIRDLGYPLELSVMDICPHFCGMCPDVHGFSPGLICYRLVLPLLHRGRPLQIPPSSPNKKGPHPKGCGPFMETNPNFNTNAPPFEIEPPLVK